MSLAASLAFGGSALPAGANPLSSTKSKAADAQDRVSASEAKVARTVSQVSEAQAKVARIDADLQAASERLDKLVDTQTRLQRHLGTRAEGMYRMGAVGALEMLGGSASFDEFTTKLDFLARIARQDATAIAELKDTRAEVKAQASQLMKQQAVASAELRKMEDAKAQAQRELASNQAQFVSYKRQVAQLEAKATADRKARKRAAQAAASSSGGSSPSPSQASGTGAWKSALCSMYGPGQIGESLAGGGRLTADAMIVAHKTLPFGTLVEFSYNDRRCVAEVRDRGPYYGAREFDLGLGPARVLGFSGVGRVQYRIVD